MGVYIMPNPVYCECSDGGCPACHGNCDKVAVYVVYRVDMEDETGTPMCEACMEDAAESGLFRVSEGAFGSMAR